MSEAPSNVLRWRAALHKSTHAIVCYAIKQRVYTIEVDDEGGGAIRHVAPGPVPRTAEQDAQVWAIVCESFEKYPPSPNFVRDSLLILLAPCHAVFRLTGDTSVPGCADDLRRARTMVDSLAISQDQRDALLDEVHATLRRMVDRYWREITLVAARLYEVGRLLDEDIRQLLRRSGAGQVLLLRLTSE